LYGKLLFQSGRFRRVARYTRLTARECVAMLWGAADASWFADGMPRDLALGDPGVRDAAIHAVQACIPHETILPSSVRRIRRAGWLEGGAIVRAIERLHEGNRFVYDLEIANEDGKVVEQWEGLELRSVAKSGASVPAAGPLLGPYVERRLLELGFEDVDSVTIGTAEGKRRSEWAEAAVRRRAGSNGRVFRRPDGWPEAQTCCVSSAHADGISVAVIGQRTVACDVEAVVARSPETWRSLIGDARFELARTIAREVGEEANVSTTRLWTALECSKKAGALDGGPTTLVSKASDGWVVLRAGDLVIATVALPDGSTVLGVAAAATAHATPYYEYRHVVGFEETNVVGNVYYANLVLWQGRCREMFLRDRAPEMLDAIRSGLSLVTTRVSCRYLAQLWAFDEVIIRMRLAALSETSATMTFEYIRNGSDGREDHVAEGDQEVACLARTGNASTVAPLPEALVRALRSYMK